MNYLQLVNEVLKEAGLSDRQLSASEMQSGMPAKVAGHVRIAWMKIQALRPNWRFMWREPASAVALTVGVSRYGNAMFCPYGLSNLDSDNLYVRESGGHFRKLKFLTWEGYCALLNGQDPQPGTPAHVSVTPAYEIAFDRAPAVAVDVKLSHFVEPQLLSAASDVPRLPAALHPIIVYQALMLYAKHDNAPDVYASAKEEFDFYSKLLDREQKPVLSFARSPLTAAYGD